MKVIPTPKTKTDNAIKRQGQDSLQIRDSNNHKMVSPCDQKLIRGGGRGRCMMFYAIFHGE